ncbi:MAG: VOC family protein [Actinomycetota bacterium]|nr:VOC family protein [Actinomycetota bacterium]
MTDWQLTIDANDPARMVAFWALALGYAVQPPPEGHRTWNDYYRSVGVPETELDATGDGTDRIYDPAGQGPKIWFQLVPETKQVKNRLHLDLYPGGGRTVPREERVRRARVRIDELVAAGATVARVYPDDFDTDADPDHWFAVLLDPEGNEFCVS